MEQFIFYFLIFCIGTLFGSFFTLAVYRLPLHQDITHKRSYCPNCNHKLGFWDMIPILSYLALKGKCHYCKEKIRIRYLLLEILSGTIFLLFAMSLNLSFEKLEVSKLVYLLVGLLYFAGLIIIAGIDKERKTIQKCVILYETIILAGYMIYLYIVEKANIYRYVISLLLLIILIIIDNKYLKKKIQGSYVIEILQLSIIMIVFSYPIGYIITVFLSLVTFCIENIIRKIMQNSRGKNYKAMSYFENLPIGFYLTIFNIITIIGINWFACRW